MEKIFFLDNKIKPLYKSLYMSIVNEIMKGKLKADEKMPSIRSLSKFMNISRTTIENTYDQLLAEGYIYSKPKVGYFVMKIEKYSEEKNVNSNYYIEESYSIKYDFLNEYVENENFNIGIWKRNINRVINENEKLLYSKAEPFGEKRLKEEIVKYFTRVRGIRATIEQVIIGAGSGMLLNNLARVLKTMKYHNLIAENPGYIVPRNEFFANGYNIIPIELKNNILDVKKLNALLKENNLEKTVIQTSPSYQFPYGATMPIAKRQKLLNLASKNKLYIIEDDFNNELDFEGRPVISLQGLDKSDRVIYMGSFSTLLIPSIRISFLILPKNLVNNYKKMYNSSVNGASKLEQLALAKMIEEGDFGRHIRRLKKHYKKKFEIVNKYLQEKINKNAKIIIEPAGVTFVVLLKNKVHKKLIYEAMNIFRIRFILLSDLKFNEKESDLEKGFVLNYRGMPINDLKKSIEILNEVLIYLEKGEKCLD